jgi:hypothetical protein
MLNWKDYFTYNEDGTLTNNATGKIAGGLTKDGYIRIRLYGKEYRAHRIVWEMHNGEIPKGILIDHINRIKTDNRIENLRLATHTQNLQNQPGRRGVSGLPKGVQLTSSNKFRAKIRINGLSTHLGTFNTAEEAGEAYTKKSIELHGEFAYNE